MGGGQAGTGGSIVIDTIYAKLAGIALFLLLLAGLFLWGDFHGAARVQAKWNVASSAQQVAVAEAKLHADAESAAMQKNYNALSAKYEDALHVQAPAVADSTLAAVTGGTLQLRDVAVCPGRGNVSATAAAARAADAAATAALTQRVTDSIAAVRVGDASDQRERQYAAQIVALQGLLRAERQSVK